MVINSLTKIIQEYHHISTNPLWTFPLWDGPYLVNPWVLTAWIQLVTWGPCLCSDSFDLWTFLCRSPVGGNGTFTNKVLLVPHDFKDDFNDYSIYTIYLFPKVILYISSQRCGAKAIRWFQIPKVGWRSLKQSFWLLCFIHCGLAGHLLLVGTRQHLLQGHLFSLQLRNIYSEHFLNLLT